MFNAHSKRIPEDAICDERGFLIRSFRPADLPDVTDLYHRGLLTGWADPDDHALDSDDVSGSYFSQRQDHFWVAEARGAVIGTIAIRQDDAGVSHIRRLRVAPLWQLDSSVFIALVRTAIAHAHNHDCLKLFFHTSLPSDRAIRLLEDLGFQVAPLRDASGHQVVEAYRDLYRRDSGGTAGDAPSVGQN